MQHILSKSKMQHILSKSKLQNFGYCIVGSIFTVGAYRGCNDHYLTEIKNKPDPVTIKDYVGISIFGLLYGSLYIIPACSIYCLYHEYSLFTKKTTNSINPYLFNQTNKQQLE
jgi:hypothetical protein